MNCIIPFIVLLCSKIVCNIGVLKNYVAEIKLEITDGWHMVRKVDKTKLLTVVGIIIFLFGGAVRIFLILLPRRTIILKILMLLSFGAYYRLGCVCCISHCSEEYTNLPCDICGAYALVDGSSCHKIQQPCRHQHIRTVSLVFILHSNGVFAAYDVFCNAEYR